MRVRAWWLMGAIAGCGDNLHGVPDAAEVPHDIAEQSGSRLKIEWWLEAGSRRYFRGIYDSQLGQECTIPRRRRASRWALELAVYTTEDGLRQHVQRLRYPPLDDECRFTADGVCTPELPTGQLATTCMTTSSGSCSTLGPDIVVIDPAADQVLIANEIAELDLGSTQHVGVATVRRTAVLRRAACRSRRRAIRARTACLWSWQCR